MKETLEFYDNSDIDKNNQYKTLAVKIWSHYKRDKCKKYDERLTDKKIGLIISKAENISEKYFVTRYKGSKKLNLNSFVCLQYSCQKERRDQAQI